MSTIDASRERTWPSALLFAGSLLPALVAALPLTMGAAWYLSADENEPYLTPARVVWMLVAFTVALVPFLAAGVALVSVRIVGRSWRHGLRVGSCWALAFGCVACGMAMLISGGF